MAKQSFKGELSRCLSEKEVEWKISRFIPLSRETGVIFESTEFYFVDSKYQLVIKSNDYNNENSNDCCDDGNDAFHWLFLRRNYKKSPSQKIEVTFNFMWSRFENSIDTKYKLEKIVNWDSSTFCLELYKFKRSKLLEQSSANDEQLILTVLCRMKICDLKESEKVPPVSTFEDLNTLSGHMDKLFMDGVHSDVTLRVQGKDFRAHRSILASRSSGLAVVLKNPDTESNTGVVNIMDCDPDAFRIFLKYLYTGYTGELTVGKALLLMKIVIKYSTVELRSFCVEFLRLHLAVDTVCKVASAAQVYGEVELMSTEQSFFNLNSAEIFCTESWENLLQEDCQLANELLKGMASSKPIEMSREKISDDVSELDVNPSSMSLHPAVI